MNSHILEQHVQANVVNGRSIIEFLNRCEIIIMTLLHFLPGLTEALLGNAFDCSHMCVVTMYM